MLKPGFSGFSGFLGPIGPGFAESCAQALGDTGQSSAVLELAQPEGASDESLVNAQADAETASPAQPKNGVYRAQKTRKSRKSLF